MSHGADRSSDTAAVREPKRPSMASPNSGGGSRNRRVSSVVNLDASAAVVAFMGRKKKRKPAPPVPRLVVPVTGVPGPGAYTLPDLPSGRSCVIQPPPWDAAPEATSGRNGRSPSPNGSGTESETASNGRRSPRSARPHGATDGHYAMRTYSGAVASVGGVPQQSDMRPLRGTFDPPACGWSPRYAIHGAPRAPRTMLGVDLYAVSQRPGPGQYFPSLGSLPRSMGGRDRSLRPKLPLERFNAGAWSVRLPDAALTPR